MKRYTGVGSRKTPTEILQTMKRLATRLASDGWILRSGGAVGADTAFEVGCNLAAPDSQREIFLPESYFNGKVFDYDNNQTTAEAYRMAEQYHPNWKALSDYGKSLMARNCYQVLGVDLKTPSHFLVCWTPDGCEAGPQRSIETGGTGQAIEIAWSNGIPVFNLKNEDAMAQLERFLETMSL